MNSDKFDIEFALPIGMKRILEVKDTFRIENDVDYYYLLDAIATSKAYALKHNNRLDEEMLRKADTTAFMFYRQYLDEVRSYPAELQALRVKLLAESSFTPTFERFYAHMEATPVERDIFEYVFFSICSAGLKTLSSQMFNRYYGGDGMGTTLNLCDVLGCSVDDVLAFYSSNSKWVKQKIVTTVGTPFDPVSALSEGCCTALMGIPLSSKQYLSIESDTIRKFATKKKEEGNTAAALLTCDEPDAEELPSITPGLVRNSSLADSSVDPNEFSDMQSLYSLLKREEESLAAARLKTTATASAGDLPSGGRQLVSESDDMELADEGKGSEERSEGKSLQDQAPITMNKDEEEVELKPYKNDLAYMQDQIELSNCLNKIAGNNEKLEQLGEDDDDEDAEANAMHDYDRYGRPVGREKTQQKSENLIRKLRLKERIIRGKIAERLTLTKAKGGWYPRLERLVEALKLSPFEKHVIVSLIRTVISPAKMMDFRARSNQKCRASVGALLGSYCGSLEERMNFRKYFYKDSRLVTDGILNMMGQDFMSDLTDCEVEIDRRMLDFCVGLDTEFSEIVDGSHLYSPNVEFDDIILPDETKNLVLETVSNYDRLKQVEKDLEIDKKISYGRGIVLLFHGLSGTGKTMLANGIASKLNKKILLINFPTLGANSAGHIIKLIFREAKIHNAIIFFDECESLFQTRERGSANVNMILTELERHEGLSIMATNRASDLDEAMYRRISLAIEFRKPDHILREKIWRSLCPPKLQLAADVDMMELALKYELTGGFIKNSWLAALSFAVARDSSAPIVTQDDLKKACSHQLRGRLSMVDFDRRIVPTRGLDMVILPDTIKETLQDIVNFGKAQSILFGQWGFSSQHGGSKGIGALFCGPPGTGKTMAAEAIGYDLGRPLKVVNCSQLISKWVGESAKNIEAVFQEAKAVDAILVFDEAEGLFGARDDDSGGGAGRHDTANVGILLHHIETFPGVVIVITNLRQRIDTAFFRRFKFVLDFPRPTAVERTKLWRLLIPKEAPLAPGVDFNSLATRFDFCGGNIKTVVFRAASRAALRVNPADRVIRMEDLTRACEEEGDKTASAVSDAMKSMYS